MNKITVFWIEDNPIQTNEEEINGKKYPKFLHTDCFTYCIFQHPKQVHEYLSMINKLNGNTSSLAEKCQEALPDIVVFDYKLSEAFKNNTNALSYTDDDHYTYLKSKSASHKLKETFDSLFKTQELFLDTNDVMSGLYMADKFKTELKAEKMLPDDEFGLYCGIAIIREFKEYTTIGVPATINKADKTTMSYNSLFYEWLNSYDLKGAIERPVPTTEKVKDWSEILNFSADLLRKRVETQIQVGKAIPYYSQLCALAEGNIPNERVFSVETIYGKRDLPLDGLFIDVADKNELKTKIEVWAKGILNKLPITNTVIKKANDTATTLWNTYLNEFEDRIVLSDYTSRICSLNGTEKTYLEEVKTRLGINPITGLFTNECSIKTLLQSEKDKNVKRLTFLITVTKATIELEKQRVVSNFNEKYAAFTSYDYVNILFPKVNFKNSVLLSMNVTDKDKQTEAERKWLSDNLTIDTSNKVTVGDIFQIEKWMLKGEKEILKSLFYNDSKYYPQWLK